MAKPKARFPSLTSAAFNRKNYGREFLIDQILVKRQLGILGGPKKGLKTSLQVEMAIALATATPFLGEFNVPRAKRVAIFSGETAPPTTRLSMTWTASNGFTTYRGFGTTQISKRSGRFSKKRGLMSPSSTRSTCAFCPGN
jgi:hypothetical protein